MPHSQPGQIDDLERGNGEALKSGGQSADLAKRRNGQEGQRSSRKTAETSEKETKPAANGSPKINWEHDLVDWESPDDPSNPQNWPKRRKMKTTLLYGLNTMSATFASSIFSASSPFIARQYEIGTEVSILGLSLFIAGFAVGPILWAPLSEVAGRKVAIAGPMFVFACFSAATATAENLQTIFITRFFAGVFSSSPVTIVGGALADIWNQRERGGAIVIYSLCIVGGPTIAPAIGAAMSESYLTWRWTEYLCCILTSVMVLVDIIFLEETSPALLLSRKAKRLRSKTGNWALHAKFDELDHSIQGFLQKMLFVPLEMLVKEPMVLFITTLASSFLCWGKIAHFALTATMAFHMVSSISSSPPSPSSSKAHGGGNPCLQHSQISPPWLVHS